MCDIINFPGGRIAAPPEACIAAVDDCGGDPKALLALAYTSLVIVRSGTLSDPLSGDFLRTASLALTELLGTGRAQV